MDPNQDLIEALSSTPESLYRDYMSAAVRLKPDITGHLAILLVDTFPGFGILDNVGSNELIGKLPKVWHQTQSALARAFRMPLEKGRHELPTDEHLIRKLQGTDLTALKELLVVLYHYQIARLIQEMKEAGINLERQQDVLGRMAEPLQRYSKTDHPGQDR